MVDYSVRSVCWLNVRNRQGRVLAGNPYGAGAGKIWLDDVSCRGDELSLEDCGHNKLEDHNCHHDEDVSIACRVEDVTTEKTVVAVTALGKQPPTPRLSNSNVSLGKKVNWCAKI